MPLQYKDDTPAAPPKDSDYSKDTDTKPDYDEVKPPVYKKKKVVKKPVDDTPDKVGGVFRGGRREGVTVGCVQTLQTMCSEGERVVSTSYTLGCVQARTPGVGGGGYLSISDMVASSLGFSA
jgi:hypothetical protein